MTNTRHVVIVHSSTDFLQLCRDVKDHKVNIDVNKKMDLSLKCDVFLFKAKR